MAKATLSIELVHDTAIEIRLYQDDQQPKIDRHTFGSAEEANAAMLKAMAWGIEFARTGEISAAPPKTEEAA